MNNKFATWFRRVMWLGIVINLLLAVPTIFFPNTMLRALGQRPSGDIVWTAFAVHLLLWVSVLSIPAARDPYRYRLPAILAVAERAGSAFFFLVLWGGYYPLFGFLDLVLFLVQAPLLYLAYKQSSPEWQPTT